MAKKFLDYSGLDHFLEKIKSWASDMFATKDVATTLKDGLMSSNDKASLNSSVQDLSVNGRVITYTKTDGSTATITTQDTNTTYVAMTADEASSGVGTTGRLITAKVLHDKIQDELPSVMTGATASSSGKSGLVPTPGTSQRTKYLRGDGSWETPTDTTYVNATTSTAGLMSASDKTKFNTMSTWYDGVVGTDSDKVVNKWDEIVDFLDGIPEGDTLDGLIEAVKTQVGDLKADIEDGTVKAKESKTLGHETIGSTTKPIYLTSGVATPCTYTLGTSVPSDAKFTDNNTTYSFAGGTNKFTVTPSGGTAQEVSVTPSITNNVTYSGTLTSGQVAVLDGTTGKIKASGYTIAQSVPSDAVFTDTHHTAKNVVSNSANATANKAATNGNVHINLVENNTCRSGIKIVGSGATTVSSDANGNITILSNDTSTTYVAMTGATSTANGKEGLVPAPSSANATKYLRGDGTWSTYGIATSTANGLMSSAMAAMIHPTIWSGAKAFGDTKHENRIYLYGKGTTFYFISDKKNDAGSALVYTMINEGNIGNYKAGSASVADKLGTAVVGSTKKPIYLNNGIATPISYTIAKSVPSNAVFTDTHHTAKNVVSNSANATANKAATNGNVHINLVENNTCRSGIKIVGSGATTVSSDANGNIAILSSDTNTTYVAMTGATSTANGKEGLVPAPTSANATKFLRGDGSWQTPKNTTYSVATTSANGLMSKSWVSKMDRITVTPDGMTAIGEYGIPTKRIYMYGTGFYYTPDNSNVYTVVHTGNISNAKSGDSTKWNGYNISVVSSLPSSKDSKTIYFVTG